MAIWVIGLCVCNYGVYVDNLPDAVHQLLISDIIINYQINWYDVASALYDIH